MAEEVDKTKDESLKEKSRGWGGARNNAGRPYGSMNTATKKQKVVQEEFRQRVLKSMDTLITSQMNLAEGVQMLYKISKDDKGKNKKPVIVTSQYEIESYLAGEQEDKSEYYFITTERPDNRALDSLIDRVFGKSTHNIDVQSGGKPLPIFNINDLSTNNSHKEDNEPKE